ncbi:RES family NAD+ phosphorylase [Salinarimonas chemoclinalis]|uniref:RES family NAD+ phosphorylase n=1 Tax=Salinarimonas chemoclinalis TaxID=3241599 RepID=UPI00355846EB
MAGVLPPASFASSRLELGSVRAGSRWKRISWRAFTDPLGFGHAPSRFGDPRTDRPEAERYAVVYLGTSTSVCFLEAVLRDRAVGTFDGFALGMTELADRTIATIEVRRDLNVLDLTGDGIIRAGIPTDAVRASDQTLGRAWALAIHEHAAKADGILYDSRLNGERNLAVFQRSIESGLAVVERRPLLDDPEMIMVLDRFAVAICDTPTR